MVHNWFRQIESRWNWSVNHRSLMSRRRKRKAAAGSTEPLEERCLLSSVSVIASDPFATEGSSTGTFVFSRDGSLFQTLSLSFSLSGSATAGGDYQSLGGSITIPAGAASVSVAVVPIADSTVEGTESITVTLGPVAGYSTDLVSATISVRDAFDGAGVDALVPLNETFSLHSLPGSHHTIYLDFDGGVVNDPSWNSGSTINVNPFSLDAANAFNDSELATIQRAWEVVAEDFRPFGIDVTTELPNIEKLRKVGASDTEWGVRVMIGDPIEYNTGATGRAQTGSFNAAYDAVVWVDLSNSGFTVQNARTVGGIASHEIGHALYLDHDTGSPGGEYYEGQGTGEADWSPIMGNIFPSSITTWSQGSYPTAGNFEDDLAIMSTQNGFTYRPDDHADSAPLATPLSVLSEGHLLGEGIIERNTDSDLFSFVSTGGATRISVAPTSVSPNVDLMAELFDSAMNLIATSDVTSQLAAMLNQILSSGTYFIRVSGTGNLTWNTGGYDDYGSLGAYAVEIGGSRLFQNGVDGYVGTADTQLLAGLPATSNGSAVLLGADTSPQEQSLLQFEDIFGSGSGQIPLGSMINSATLNLNVTDFGDRVELHRMLTAWTEASTWGSFGSGIQANGIEASTTIDGTISGNVGTASINVTAALSAWVADPATNFGWALLSTGTNGIDIDSSEAASIISRPSLVVRFTAPSGSIANVAPVASNDNASTGINMPVTVIVLGNDTDANGDALSVGSISTLPTHGTVVLNANNTITYTPSNGYIGGDSFTYVANDGSLNSNVATVSIAVVDDETPPPPPVGVAAQYSVNQSPRLQLGDAPLTGYAGSSLDQIAILWQTVSGGSGTQDSFTVQYRLAGTTNAWQFSGAIAQTVTGVGGRIVHETSIAGLQWNSRYEYRVRHLRAGGLVQQWNNEFHTRLQSGDSSSFSFVAYGDSASASSLTGFRNVQSRINQMDPAFAVLLGDNVYTAGSHTESDARFSPALNPEATTWMGSHIDYPGFGNHDIGTSSGEPSEQNFAVPVPVTGADSPVAPPSTERAEHNFSWDYGDVHFVTFDSNSYTDPIRRAALISYVVADLNASTARWKIVYGHHPIASAPEKESEWNSTAGRSYYDDAVSRFTAAGVDLFLVGHSHTFSWTHPLTGRLSNGAIAHDNGDYDSFATGTGLVQVVAGTGGAGLRSGSHSNYPYVAAAWTTNETYIDGVVNPTSQRSEDGFAKIDVTPESLTISYIAADNGAVIGSLTITDHTSTNQTPVANDDYAVTNVDSLVEINVLDNDTDPESQSLTPSILAQPAHGTATVNASGTITYVPATGYVGSDSFTYLVSDGVTNSNPASVSLTVNAQQLTLAQFDPVGSQSSANLSGTTGVAGVTVGSLSRVGAGGGTNTNVFPVYWYGSQTLDTAQYLTFAVTTTGALSADFENLTVSFQEWVNGTSNVALRTSLDGFSANVDGIQALADSGSADVVFDLSVLPRALGTTTFRIYVFDTIDGTSGWRDIRSSSSNNGQGILLEGTVVPNFAPVAMNDTVSTNEDAPIPIHVLGNDSDSDGNSLTPVILTQPTHGTANVNANGMITYTPAANYNGSDSFTYRVTDGGLNSNVATINISIAAVNDAPTAVDNFFSTNFSTVLDVPAASGVLANDSDVDSNALTASLITGPLHGGVTLNASGSFQYAPTAGYVGTDSFTYSVTDGLLTSQASVTVTVNPPPDDHSNLLNSTATAISLSGGTRGQGFASGNLEVADDRDVFRVAVANGVITLGLNGVNGLDTYLRVYNSVGTLIGSDDDSGPGFSSALSLSVSSGTYYISAGSYADSATGSFTLEVEHREKKTKMFQHGVGGYSSSSDTFLSGDLPNTSRATAVINEVDLSSTTFHEHTLLQFRNLFGSGANEIPFGSEIVSATLTFYVVNSGDRVNIHRMLTAWTDAATWNSMGSGIQADGIEAVPTPDAQTPVFTSTGWQNLVVTSTLVAWAANPAKNFGWALLPTNTDGVDIYSVNNSSNWVPRISVEYLTPKSDLHANTPDASASSLPVVNNYASLFGTLETAGDRDVFQFTLTQTRTITINLSATGTGTPIDTYLRLYNASGMLIAENDNATTGTNSRLTLTLGPGTYFVSVAVNLDTGIGDYWLELFL